MAKLEGIDLVTEGIITMQHALELIRAYAHDEPGRDQVLCQGRDGAHLLAQCLVQNSTSITFMVGRALNPAYDGHAAGSYVKAAPGARYGKMPERTGQTGDAGISLRKGETGCRIVQFR